MTRAAEPFDRLTGCQSLESSERQGRLEAVAAWPWLYARGIPHPNGSLVRVRVLGQSLWDSRPVGTIVDDDGVEQRTPAMVLAAAVEALRESELAERRALEQAQTDARAIAWLRERGLLVETVGGQWVLK